MQHPHSQQFNQGYHPGMMNSPGMPGMMPGGPGMPGMMPGGPGMPGMMHGGPGMPGMMHGGPGMSPPGMPGMGPIYHNPGPGFGGPMPQQQNLPTNGCFMPAATIRKISNTTPPRFDQLNN